ncbi:phosphatase PAP2 family protein [Mobilicoccus sp.]|uniref:phosphatase PAP2 family protein n=1 Tax=Mobilicoccus sp. TaxID=2034349 RepID=UPI0028A8B772|nr:phosphatase PAP2 family protein [Mobilicoccus sp.]
MSGWGTGRVGRVLVALGGLAVVACVVLVVWTHLGQRADERSRWSVAVPWRTSRILEEWLGLVSVEFIAVVLVIAVLLALARRRTSRGLAAIVLVAGANVATQILKAGLPRPDHGIGSENTLPSGHVTVVTSLVLAALFVVPARWRRVVALLAAGAGTLTGAAVLLQRWHRPSDVIAAYGVCAVFAGLGLLLADRTSRRVDAAWTGPIRVESPTGSVLRRHALPAFAGALLAGVFLLLAGMVTHGETSNVVVGAVVLGAMGVVCATLVALVSAGLDALPAPPAVSEKNRARPPLG